MKGFLTLTLCTLFTAPAAFANGESLSIREEARGAAAVDEEYVDELKTQDAALERKSQSNKTRQRMEKNPRNPAMVESFEGVSSEEEQQNEEQKVKDKQEVRDY